MQSKQSTSLVAVAALALIAALAPAPARGATAVVPQSDPPDGLGMTSAGATPVTVDADAADDPLDKDTVEELARDYPPGDPVFGNIARQPLLPGGIDHLAAGTGLRNSGYGTIRLRGVPQPGAVLVSAYVYWGMITATPAPVSVTFAFNGYKTPSYLIGTAPEPCWHAPGTVFASYRATVLTHILPGINGDYSVDGLPSHLTDGRDPFAQVDITPPMAEGASLVVLFSHSSVPATSWVDIDHVPYESNGDITITHFLTLPITNNNFLKFTRLGADGQSGSGLVQYSSVSDDKTFIGPVGSPTIQLKGTGSLVNTDSDWNGADGEPLNQLWDTHTQRIDDKLAVGTTVYQVRYLSPNDCINPVAHVLTAR